MSMKKIAFAIVIIGCAIMMGALLRCLDKMDNEVHTVECNAYYYNGYTYLDCTFQKKVTGDPAGIDGKASPSRPVKVVLEYKSWDVTDGRSPEIEVISVTRK